MASRLPTLLLVAFGAGCQSPENLGSLTADERAASERGRGLFTYVFTAAEGLGPFYNAQSCFDCHGIPAVGGTGTTPVTRAGFRELDGGFREPSGGSLVPHFSLSPDPTQSRLPPGANVIAERQALPLFGAGLLEAVPDAALRALEQNANKPPGVRGRVNWVPQPDGTLRAGRLGWKAGFASLEAFIAVALRDELGLTSSELPAERIPQGQDEAVRTQDTVAEPEVADGTVGDLTAFLRFLAPLHRTAEGLRGEAIFARLECTSCHAEELETGDAHGPALRDRRLRAYSDLLLHDVGTGDGVSQDGASAGEFRTPPLWGLGRRRPYLHDGRAATLPDALEAHGEEAAEVRERWRRLGGDDRDALLAFLESL